MAFRLGEGGINCQEEGHGRLTAHPGTVLPLQKELLILSLSHLQEGHAWVVPGPTAQ